MGRLVFCHSHVFFWSPGRIGISSPRSERKDSEEFKTGMNSVHPELDLCALCDQQTGPARDQVIRNIKGYRALVD